MTETGAAEDGKEFPESRKEELGAHHVKGDEASKLLPWVGSVEVEVCVLRMPAAWSSSCLCVCFICTFESLFYFSFDS